MLKTDTTFGIASSILVMARTVPRLGPPPRFEKASWISLGAESAQRKNIAEVDNRYGKDFGRIGIHSAG